VTTDGCWLLVQGGGVGGIGAWVILELLQVPSWVSEALLPRRRSEAERPRTAVPALVAVSARWSVSSWL